MFHHLKIDAYNADLQIILVMYEHQNNLLPGNA